MPPISNRKIEAFLVLEEIMHQTVVFINLVIALLKENNDQTRRLEQAVRRYSMIDRIPNQMNHMRRLINLGDADCVANLRMNRNAFSRLCYLMEHIGGLVNSRYVSVEEKVAMFLSILAHHKKNRIVKYDFLRSGQTVSKHIHVVLKALFKISSLLLVEPAPISDDCTHPRWSWFKGCLGALDGTHIRVKVPVSDKPRYRTRKGEIAVNVLGVCDRDMKFVYVLPGWEGSAADARVLRDAVNRTHGLKVPKGCYYLCDNGYPNSDGFLTPYKSVRYHLNEWGESSARPRTFQEYFNMKHSRARNVIERTFGLLKMRWGILRSPSYYSIKIQNRIIMACCLLHNFIRMEMEIDPIELLVDEPTGNINNDIENDDVIDSVETSPEWNTFRDNLAQSMFNAWRHVA